MEIAFTRAAGSRFSDGDAAWKLVDKSLLKLDAEGNVTGTDEAIEKLADAYPFLHQTDGDDDTDDTDSGNPFKPKTSGSPMRKLGNKRLNAATTSAAILAKKYPALRGR